MRREVAPGDVADLARARVALLVTSVVNAGFLALYVFVVPDIPGFAILVTILGVLVAVEWLAYAGIARGWAWTWWCATVPQSLWTIGAVLAVAADPFNPPLIAFLLLAIWTFLRLIDPALIRTFVRRPRPPAPVEAVRTTPDWGFLDGAPYVPPPLPPVREASAPFVPPAAPPVPPVPRPAPVPPPDPYAAPTGQVRFGRSVEQRDVGKVAQARRALLVTAVLDVVVAALLALSLLFVHGPFASDVRASVLLILLAALALAALDQLSRYGMRRLWAWTWWLAVVLHGLYAASAAAALAADPGKVRAVAALLHAWVVYRLLHPAVLRTFVRHALKPQPAAVDDAPDPRFSWDGAVLTPGGRVVEGYVPPPAPGPPPPPRPAPGGFDYFG